MTTCEDKKRMLRILFGTMNPCAERVVDQFATAFRTGGATMRLDMLRGIKYLTWAIVPVLLPVQAAPPLRNMPSLF